MWHVEIAFPIITISQNGVAFAQTRFDNPRSYRISYLSEYPSLKMASMLAKPSLSSACNIVTHTIGPPEMSTYLPTWVAYTLHTYYMSYITQYKIASFALNRRIGVVSTLEWAPVHTSGVVLQAPKTSEHTQKRSHCTHDTSINQHFLPLPFHPIFVSWSERVANFPITNRCSDVVRCPK